MDIFGNDYSEDKVLPKPKEIQHIRVINEERFTPQSEVNVSNEFTDTQPDRPFKEMMDIVDHDPRLELALDTYVQMILGSGLKVTADKKKVEKKITEWFDEIDFENKLENGLYSYVATGNLLFEREPNTNSDFVEVPIDSVTSIIRNKKGKILKYIQKVNNTPNPLPPEDIIHFKFTDARREIWGRGIFHAVINDFTDPQTGTVYQAPIFGMKDLEDGLVKIIQNTASPIKIFHFEDAGETFIEKQGDALKKARPGATILTDKKFDLEIIEAKGDSKFEKWIEHLQRNVLEPGTEFPLQFFNAGFTARAASESTDSVLIRKVKRIQKRLSNQIKELMVMPYLKKTGNTVDKDEFDIKFEFEDKTEFDLNHIITMFRDNIIKRSEARKNILKHTNIDINQDDMEDLLPITSVTPTNKLGDEDPDNDDPDAIPQREKPEDPSPKTPNPRFSTVNKKIEIEERLQELIKSMAEEEKAKKDLQESQKELVDKKLHTLDKISKRIG